MRCCFFTARVERMDDLPTLTYVLLIALGLVIATYGTLSRVFGRAAMFRKVLLAAALQNWETPNPYARAAREIAIQLAKGSSNPLYVLTLYHYQAPTIEKNPFIGSQVLQETEQLMQAEEDAVRAAVEAKLRHYVQDIEDAGVAVVCLVRPGDPREEVIRVAAEVRADLIVIGSHSKRRLFDIGSTAQTICKRSPVVVVLAAPAQ